MGSHKMLGLDAAEALYGVLANVDWEAQSAEWRAAAYRARSFYHVALHEAYPAVGGAQPEVVLPSIESRVVAVLRTDYEMLKMVAIDRLAALDQAFPRERLPIESQTGQSWPRRQAQSAVAVPTSGTRQGNIPEFADPADVGHPI